MADWWSDFTTRAGDMLIGGQMQPFGSLLPPPDPSQRRALIGQALLQLGGTVAGAPPNQPVIASLGQGFQSLANQGQQRGMQTLQMGLLGSKIAESRRKNETVERLTKMEPPPGWTRETWGPFVSMDPGAAFKVYAESVKEGQFRASTSGGPSWLPGGGGTGGAPVPTGGPPAGADEATRTAWAESPDGRDNMMGSGAFGKMQWMPSTAVSIANQTAWGKGLSADQIKKLITEENAGLAPGVVGPREREMKAIYDAQSNAALTAAGLPLTPSNRYVLHFGPAAGVSMLKSDPFVPVGDWVKTVNWGQGVSPDAVLRQNNWNPNWTVGELRSKLGGRVGPTGVPRPSIAPPQDDGAPQAAQPAEMPPVTLPGAAQVAPMPQPQMQGGTPAPMPNPAAPGAAGQRPPIVPVQAGGQDFMPPSIAGSVPVFTGQPGQLPPTSVPAPNVGQPGAAGAPSMGVGVPAGGPPPAVAPQATPPGQGPVAPPQAPPAAAPLTREEALRDPVVRQSVEAMRTARNRAEYDAASARGAARIAELQKQTQARVDRPERRQMREFEDGVYIVDLDTGEKRRIGDRPTPRGEGREFTEEDALRKEYVAQAKPFQDLRGNYQRILAAGERAPDGKPSPAADMAMVFSFMKMLDPTSVVRESEYATAQNAAGVPDRIRNIYNKVLTGEGLNPEQRKDFADRAARIFDRSYGEYEETRKVFRELATAYGRNPDRVAPDFTAGVKRPVLAPDPAAPPSASGQTGAQQPVPQITKGTRASDPRTGQIIEWTGRAWIDIKTLKPVEAGGPLPAGPAPTR